MKYKAIIETDDYKDFEFFEDGIGKYIHGIDAGSVNNEWIPLYFTECEQEPFINKSCVSSEVCEHDKQKILDKIRAEMEQLRLHKAQFITSDNKVCIDSQEVLNIIDKYKAESEISK